MTTKATSNDNNHNNHNDAGALQPAPDEDFKKLF
jgi:hypothetical protein